MALMTADKEGKCREHTHTHTKTHTLTQVYVRVLGNNTALANSTREKG